MAAKIYLPVVDDPDGTKDCVLHPIKGMQMPMFIGDEQDENLACGQCKTVVAKHVSTQTLARRMGSGSGRLLIHCTCGAYALVNIKKVG